MVAPVIAPGRPLTVTVAVVIQPVAAVYVIVAVPVVAPAVHVPPDVTDAVPVALLAHVPPGVALLSVADWPTHSDSVPVMADGSEFTVNVFVDIQPDGRVYVIVVVPGLTPPATPVPAAIVPVAGVLLLHIPPDTACVIVVVRPWHTVELPVIAAGAGVTVTTSVEIQPALSA